MKTDQFKQRFNLYEKLMRLDKPIGILLLLWPTLWALWISSHGRPDWVIVWVFLLGTVLMRSAGCVMNDIADRNFDPHVERTKHRPLAAGLVSTKEDPAAGNRLGLACIPAGIAIKPVNNLFIFRCPVSGRQLPLTKRFLSIPQAYLGIAFGFGIPMAYAAQLNHLSPIAWWLLTANVLWAIAYDTEYAMVDRDDDIRIGIRSSALFFGRFDVAAIMLCYVGTLAILAYIGLRLGLKWPYFSGLVAAAGLAVYHFTLIRQRDRVKCFKAFLHNNWVGAAIFIGIAANYLVK